MRSRWIVALSLGLLALFIAPQVAQPLPQDDEDNVGIKERVKPHIASGVEFLRARQGTNGCWAWRENNTPQTPEVVGATALAGLAMMEAGVAENDKQILKAAEVVRRGAGNYNYSNCLCVMFLDRLHKKNMREKDGIFTHSETSTILSMASKITKGQGDDGGWGYNYPGASDNSNTQFAVVALWISRKYTKPGGDIDKALKKAEKKFRTSQHRGGSWAYDMQGSGSALGPTASMTCAGLLGLALGAGTDRRQQEAQFRGQGASSSGSIADPYQKLAEDPQVREGKAYLVAALPSHTDARASGEHSTYFLWSLERVCKLYRWNKRNFGLDWFAMGANWLISKQDQRTGGWSVDHLTSNPNVDTSFALLFLAESNLLGGLSNALFEGDKGVAAGPTIVPRKPIEKAQVDPGKHSVELAEKLKNAPPGKQREDLLAELEESRGVEYTDALVNVIGTLASNEAKEAARETLRKRLQRLKKDSLAKCMGPDEPVELRLAAAVAARYKNDPEIVESVIPMLADTDAKVVAEAHAALKSLTGQDFGTSVDKWAKYLEQSKKLKKEQEEGR
jgi:hypothetical protein